MMGGNYEHNVLGNGNPNHPDNQEQVLEMNAEQEFYNSEVDVPEHALIYIESLERKIKSKNEALKTLLGQTSENLTHHRKQLNLIIKI